MTGGPSAGKERIRPRDVAIKTSMYANWFSRAKLWNAAQTYYLHTVVIGKRVGEGSRLCRRLRDDAHADQAALKSGLRSSLNATRRSVR